MTNSFDESLDSVSGAPKGISRRAVSTAAAWTVPAVAVAVGAPMASASGGGVITFPQGQVTSPGGVWTNLSATVVPSSGTNPVGMTVVVSPPAGTTWANNGGTEPRTYTVANNAIVIDDIRASDGQVNHTYAPFTGTTTTPNYTVVDGNLLTSLVNVIPGTGKGAVWAQNVNTETFSTNGAPIRFASPLDALNDTPAWITSGNNIVDYNTSQDGTVIMADGAGGTKWITGGNASNGGTWVGNHLFTYYAQDNSFLATGEYLISTSLANCVLSTLGQVWYVVNGKRFHFSFIDPTYSPSNAFITQIRGSAWLSSLDSAGRVWTNISLDPTQSSSPIEQITPKLVTFNGVPLTGIVEVGEGGLARSANGTVYLISQDSNRIATVVGTDGAKLARNATPDAWAYITTAGTVKSWGNGNQNRHTSSDSNPVASPTVNANVESIRGARTVLDFAFGEQAATTVIFSDNTVYAWGDNLAAQLGNNGAPNDSAGPVQVLAGPTGPTPSGPLLATAFYGSRRSFGVKVA
ncbi:hypothetical protein HQQ81_01490 [Microbacteriaceae bacterium VKM Ac-2854]|nr:hypothetical protein [Microbacteriaceae bacterium VKM Ac-2854]